MQTQSESSASDMKPYYRLFLALMLSFLVMYIVMYSRVNNFSNVFLNLNQVYMTILMVAPMLIIMLVVMRSMYKNNKLNIQLIIAGVILIVASWFLLRNQTGVGDTGLIRAMIPHHAGAILVCEEVSLTDTRLQDLCKEIIEAQKREIREMKTIMQDYEN